MIDIKPMEKTYIEEFDISITPYLTAAQVQNIVNAMSQFDTWAERQTNRDILILYYVTDLGKETIEEIGYDTFVASGLMQAIEWRIKNIYQIDEALDYTESTTRALNKIAKELPTTIKPLKEMMEKYGNKKATKK